ncbi:MAG: trypsin-like peptidase domain-containing protein, partial [Chloroflexi bacterium]|nr:trypsin-like peptidase domain-containing protein [Chloroflexota bacterium]
PTTLPEPPGTAPEPQPALDAADIPRPPVTLPELAPQPPGSGEPSMTEPFGERSGALTDYIVSVLGGPNGTGTAFVVDHVEAARGGVGGLLLATTRTVTGGMQRLLLERSDGQQLHGYVVRAFTDRDLAVIYLEDQHMPAASGGLPITATATVPDQMPLSLLRANGQTFTATHRPTRRVMAAHWLPTSFTALPDAGGAPIFDQYRYLVGMITCNTSHNSTHLFGLHIAAIRQAVDQYQQERRSNYAYCPTCGAGSWAGAFADFFYCEHCGGVLPHAQHHPHRYPRPEAEGLYQLGNRPCPHCQAVAGIHRNRCQRCGQLIDPKGEPMRPR